MSHNFSSSKQDPRQPLTSQWFLNRRPGRGSRLLGLPIMDALLGSVLNCPGCGQCVMLRFRMWSVCSLVNLVLLIYVDGFLDEKCFGTNFALIKLA